MAKTIDEIIEQVKALNALATSANANEAAAAAAAANRLIDKYRLSQADLESEVTEPVVKDQEYIYQSGKVSVWKSKLVHTLTRHYGVAYYNDTDFSSGRKISRYIMIGKKSDLEVCRYMFSWLSLECERLSNLEAKGTGMGRIFVSSYQEGFVAGVGVQLNLSRQEMKKEATSTAIVKIDSRFAEAESGMYAMVPSLRTVKARSYRRMDNRAYGMGKERGQAIHLGAAMSSSAGSRMLKS